METVLVRPFRPHEESVFIQGGAPAHEGIPRASIPLFLLVPVELGGNRLFELH